MTEEPVFCKVCGWIEAAHKGLLSEEEIPVLAVLVEPICEEFVHPDE